MTDLDMTQAELFRLADEATRLAKTYWASLDERAAYPQTTGSRTRELFSRAWVEEPRGDDVLRDFTTMTEHSRPSGGKFFGYVFGSGEPVGALAEFLAAVLNQNVTGWRSGPAAATIEHTVVDWLA